MQNSKSNYRNDVKSDKPLCDSSGDTREVNLLDLPSEVLQRVLRFLPNCDILLGVHRKLDYVVENYSNSIEGILKEYSKNERKLHEWIENDAIVRVEKFLSHPYGFKAFKRHDCLLFAVHSAAMVNLLLNAGVSVNNRNCLGETALFYSSSAEVAAAFVQSGININIRCRKTGKNALYGYKPNAVVEVLVKAGIDVNNVDIKRENCLFSARPESVKTLVKAGINVHARNIEGKTPLFPCSSREAVQALVDVGVDVNATDTRGRTALFECCSVQKVNILAAAGYVLIQRMIKGELHCLWI